MKKFNFKKGTKKAQKSAKNATIRGRKIADLLGIVPNDSVTTNKNYFSKN